MLWYVLLSAAFHLVVVSGLIALLARTVLPVLAHRPPEEIVAISSAVRIEHRARPVPAHNPIPRPRAVQAVPREPAPPAPKPVSKPAPKPLPKAEKAPEHIATRRPREIAKIAYNAPAINQQQLQAQTQSFQQTIAQARAANDPVAGAATSNVTPEAPKRYAMNVNGSFGTPAPEGVLYPLKRWVQGEYVYYYVRYLAEYADGTTEAGVVPWPIRFPASNDPFAHDRHRMPLPGPMPDYVASSGAQMQPLVKNCYDHRYDYCPIAHE